MTFLVPCDGRADSQLIGGKARGLVQLRALGLPVPSAFVVGGLTEPWPRDFEATLAATLGAHDPGVRFAVRSSFAGEDDAAGLGAGIYESHVRVARADVPAAVRAVLASRDAAAARAYHAHHPAPATTAVLIHAFHEGTAAGHVAAEPSPREPVLWIRQGTLDDSTRAALSSDARQVAGALGHPVELEWVIVDGKPLYLQLRPYVPAPPLRPFAGLDGLPPGETPDDWHWDAAHNPWPLSPAHAGLVAMVDGTCTIGLRQRVLGGYLFFTRKGASLPTPLPAKDASSQLNELAARAQADLDRLGPAPPLEEALALFVAIYEPLIGRIGPAARAGVQQLSDRLLRSGHGSLLPALLARVPSRASQRLGAVRALQQASPAEQPGAEARFLATFGDETDSWDIAAPTRSEARGVWPVGPTPAAEPFPAQETGLPPEVAAAARGIREALPPGDRALFDQALAVARACAAVAENDDWLYARISACVRRACLALGRRLVDQGALDHPDDAFFLPLGDLRRLATSAAPDAQLRDSVATARQAWQEARANPPGLPATRAASAQVRGHGTGGRVVGRVVQDPGVSTGESVLIATTVLPTMLPMVTAAALVTETGGPLDHVAAQARERGLPAVVGAAGACAALPPGCLVLVDADQGRVVRLS